LIQGIISRSLAPTCSAGCSASLARVALNEVWLTSKPEIDLDPATDPIDKVSVRRRAIDRRLRGVEILPEMEAGAILSLPGGNGFDAEDSADMDGSEH